MQFQEGLEDSGPCTNKYYTKLVGQKGQDFRTNLQVGMKDNPNGSVFGPLINYNFLISF